jgi:hypothetical protein
MIKDFMSSSCRGVVSVPWRKQIFSKRPAGLRLDAEVLDKGAVEHVVAATSADRVFVVAGRGAAAAVVRASPFVSTFAILRFSLVSAICRLRRSRASAWLSRRRS